MKIDINYIYGLGPNFITPSSSAYQIFDDSGYPSLALPNDFYSGELKSSMDDFKKDKKYEHYLCPSVQLWHKTNWLVTMPFDIEFEWNKTKKQIEINSENYTAKFLEKIFFNLKDSRFKGENIAEIQMAFFYLFWTDQKNTIILSLNHHPELYKSNIELIPAKLPISHWIRPIHFAFKIVDINKKIFIKRGTPLFYMDFSCEEHWDANFSLIQQEKINEKVKKELSQNNLLKIYAKNSSWELIKQRLFNKSKKCPFNI